jgi:NAD-dependent deacetylase
LRSLERLALRDGQANMRAMSLLVITGAGVSLASGIPTFRGSDPGAVWANDVMEKGTLAYFQRDPVESWQWYRSRFLRYRDARPNAAHVALATLEKQRDMLLVTQNVDTLHEQAGSTRLIKVHGSADRVRCVRRGCPNGAPQGTLPTAEVDFTAFEQNPTMETLPRCSRCRSLFRPHVLWFDEYYSEHISYGFDEVEDFVSRQASEVWFLGTSLSVGITELVESYARERELPTVVVDPSTTMHGARHVREPVERWLPEQLGGSS